MNLSISCSKLLAGLLPSSASDGGLLCRCQPDSVSICSGWLAMMKPLRQPDAIFSTQEILWSNNAPIFDAGKEGCGASALQ